MGRKIPAKKHRGVKDPLVQQAKRLESLKGKINAPPVDPDEQPVPKSLLRLFGRAAPPAAPAAPARRPRPRAAPTAPAPAPARNPVAALKRLPGESGHSFARRITAATRTLHDAHDPQHYPHEEEEEADERGDRRRRGRGRGVQGRGRGGERESRARRRRDNMKAKQQLAAKGVAAEAREVVYERVSFGEQVHAPPALRPPRPPRLAPTAAPASTVPRPGRRDLLLARVLSGAGAGAGAGEARRLRAVEAYRALTRQRREEQHRQHKR